MNPSKAMETVEGLVRNIVKEQNRLLLTKVAGTTDDKSVEYMLGKYWTPSFYNIGQVANKRVEYEIVETDNRRRRLISESEQ